MESMNQERLVSIIRSSTEEVFATMLGVPVTVEKSYLEQGGSQNLDGVISLVGLAGSWVGSGRISCSAALACRLSGAMLMAEYTAVNEDVLDAMAELTNMIIGNVKSSLEDELGPMGLSIPTVIFGRNYKARSTGVDEWVVVPFRCETERLDIKFALTPNAKSSEHHRALAMQDAD
jgi:chemotaxis protein CheX